MIELKVGVVGNDNAPWAYIKQKLSKENIQITLVEFSDFFTPNQALNEGKIDLNAFQACGFFKSGNKRSRL